MEYYEKADPKIIYKCKSFISQNETAKNDYQIYREALHLCNELIDNLLLSQKDFDDAIKEELYKMPIGQDGPQMDAFIYKFNNKELILVLDKTAHEVLDLLETIEKNNRP